MGYTLLQLWFTVPNFYTCNLTFGHIETLIACMHLVHPMDQDHFISHSYFSYTTIPAKNLSTTFISNNLIFYSKWKCNMVGGFFQLYSYLKQTKTYFGHKPPPFNSNPNWRRKSTKSYSSTSGEGLSPKTKDNLSMGKTQQRTNHHDRINNFIEWEALNWHGNSWTTFHLQLNE